MGREHWLRTEGTYADGVLSTRDVSPPLVCITPGCTQRSKHLDAPCPDHGGEPFYKPGDFRCRLKMCGDVAEEGKTTCVYHTRIFAQRAEERRRQEEAMLAVKEQRRVERDARRVVREEREARRAAREKLANEQGPG